MKKKYLTNAMILSAAMVSSICLLGGCTNTDASAASVQNEQKTIQEENNTSDGETEQNKHAAGEEITINIEDDEAVVHYDPLNQFSYELFAQNMNEDNPVLSPVSAYMALSMAGLGAQNNTKEEFASVFGEDNDMTGVCYNIMNHLPVSSENNTVTLANSAWISENFSASDQWIGNVDSIMRSEVFQKDLTTTETMNDMNAWILGKTNGLIEKMIDKPLTDAAGLVLFNTIYFKAKWADPFEAHSVYDDTFYLEDQSEINTELMHKESDMDYLSNEFAQGLVFPYVQNEEQDGNFAFVALKPTDENKKIRDLYKELTPDAVKELLKNRQTKTVVTKLPKFEIDFDKQLNESLINMGLKDAFDMEAADFSGIGAWNGDASFGENNLYIDLVRQKAKIIVDEEGTEAAAATAVIMECGAAMPEEMPEEVFFDRPFVYMIMDMDREIPLFIGIFDSPLNCGKRS